MKQLTRNVLTLVAALAVVALLVIPGDTGAPADVRITGNDPAGTAMMRAHIDSESGELTTGVGPVPVSQLDAGTQNALRRDDEGLREVRHADGSVSINLEGRYQNVSVARIGEDGKVIVCTEHADGVEGVINGESTAEVK